MTDDDKKQRVTLKGWAEGFDVLVPDHRQTLGLSFVFYQDVDGKTTSKTIEVAADPDVVMALMANLKEIQRLFEIPMPDLGSWALNRQNEQSAEEAETEKATE